MKKRVISWLLTVVMVVSMLPTSVLADTLAAEQEQQTQQEQIAPVRRRRSSRSLLRKRLCPGLPASAARRWRWRKELSAPRRSLPRWSPAAIIN